MCIRHDLQKMKKCPGCGGISQDAGITCGVCSTNIADAPLIEGVIEDEIIRDQEKRQKDSGPVAPESAQRSGRSLVEFFRHCPECGRRFHIKLESKKRLNLDRETIRRPRVTQARGFTGGARRVANPQRIIVYEGEPVIIDVEEIQYNYKCKHAGTNGLRTEWKNILNADSSAGDRGAVTPLPLRASRSIFLALHVGRSFGRLLLGSNRHLSLISTTSS